MVNAPSLNVVFFGTPAFAVPALQALLRSRHQVVGAVTQPDRPRGRGQQLTGTAVKALAREHGLALLQPDRVTTPQFLDALVALHADLGVVAAYGKLLPQAVLDAPRLGFINVHASRLPKYRGAAPVHRAVIAGELQTGVTIMRIVLALDAGPMLASEARPIGVDETSEEVDRDLAVLGARLLVETIDRLALGPVTETPQDARAATYAPPLTKEEGLIDWSQPAKAVHDRVRGLHPWPHAFSYSKGRRYILLRTHWSAEQSGAPGTVLESSGDRLAIATGAGAVQVLQLQPEGRRPMTTREFLAGHPLPPGTRFGAP